MRGLSPAWVAAFFLYYFLLVLRVHEEEGSCLVISVENCLTVMLQGLGPEASCFSHHFHEQVIRMTLITS